MARTDRQPRQRLAPDARRAAILAAAAEAFGRQPYAEVTVSGIAAQAGASDALLYRYFSGKEDLYAEIVRLAIDDLQSRQTAALRALPSNVPLRERIREATLVYLDHIADHPDAWALPLSSPATEPPAAAAIRGEARRGYVERLGVLLVPGAQPRREFALWGYFGFLDAACLRWVERGCLNEDRRSLVDAVLGALEGAMGDWTA